MTKYSGKAMNKLKLCKITKCDKNQIVATQTVMKLKLQKKNSN